jgi:hypothetical protein
MHDTFVHQGPEDSISDADRPAGRSASPGRHAVTYIGRSFSESEPAEAAMEPDPEPEPAPVSRATPPGTGVAPVAPDSVAAPVDVWTAQFPPARAATALSAPAGVTSAPPGPFPPSGPVLVGPPARPDRPERYDPGRGPRSLPERGVSWVSAHGGAGATTMATHLGGTDLGCRWPDPARAEPVTVMLVARTNAAGLRAASRALNAIREGRHPAGMELAGVVLVADAPGRLPRPLLGRIRVLRAAAPVWRVPWVPKWRIGEQTDQPPHQLSNVAKRIELIP